MFVACCDTLGIPGTRYAVREPTDDEVGLNEPPADPLNDMDPDGSGDSDDSINYNDIIEILQDL